jgi:hypothetical protein
MDEQLARLTGVVVLDKPLAAAAAGATVFSDRGALAADTVARILHPYREGMLGRAHAQHVQSGEKAGYRGNRYRTSRGVPPQPTVH